jgi:hypothetical protein
MRLPKQRLLAVLLVVLATLAVGDVARADPPYGGKPINVGGADFRTGYVYLIYEPCTGRVFLAGGDHINGCVPPNLLTEAEAKLPNPTNRPYPHIPQMHGCVADEACRRWYPDTGKVPYIVPKYLEGGKPGLCGGGFEVCGPYDSRKGCLVHWNSQSVNGFNTPLVPLEERQGCVDALARECGYKRAVIGDPLDERTNQLFFKPYFGQRMRGLCDRVGMYGPGTLEAGGMGTACLAGSAQCYGKVGDIFVDDQRPFCENLFGAALYSGGGTAFGGAGLGGGGIVLSNGGAILGSTTMEAGGVYVLRGGHWVLMRSPHAAAIAATAYCGYKAGDALYHHTPAGCAADYVVASCCDFFTLDWDFPTVGMIGRMHDEERGRTRMPCSRGGRFATGGVDPPYEEPTVAGCACDLGGARPSGPASLALVAVGVVLAARRRRARRAA